MTQCTSCNSNLVTDGLTSGQQYRCANCYSFSRFGKLDRIAADRLAWRSFWLGISSVLLLTLTGIPAIYYGIRSLLRMRFVRPKRGDQAAAVIGVTLGGFFGVFIGFISFCAVLIGLLGMLTSTESRDPEQVKLGCSKFFEFEHHTIKPFRSNTTLDTQFIFQFSNDQKTETENAETENAETENVNVTLVHLRKSLQSSDASMLAMLRRKRLRGKRTGNSIGTDVFEWSMNGEAMDVKRTIYSSTPRRSEGNPEGSDESKGPDNSVGTENRDANQAPDTHHYFGYQKIDGSFYGVGLTHFPTESGLSQSDVKAMFEAIRLVLHPK